MRIGAAWFALETRRAIGTRATIIERAFALRTRWAITVRRCRTWATIISAIAEIVVTRSAGAERLFALVGRFSGVCRTCCVRCIGAHRAGERLAAWPAFVTATGFATTWASTRPTTAARLVIANVIEAAQFARFFVDMAVHVAGLRTILADLNFRRARFALADHWLQGQHRWIVFQGKFMPQRLDFFGRHLDAMAAF